ncbi:MAG: peroxidase family protein [Gammaproteobacteria bacterium]
MNPDTDMGSANAVDSRLRARAAALVGLLATTGTAPAATLSAPWLSAFLPAVANGATFAAVAPTEIPNAPLTRLASPAYADGYSSPAGAGRPSPRALSNLFAQFDHVGDDAPPLNNLFVAATQLFASHTHARTPTLPDPMNALPIPVSPDDQIASIVGNLPVMRQQRSRYVGGSGPGDPREQLNDVTPLFDGSSVYGSYAGRETRLRTGAGDGKLRSDGRGGLPIVDGRPAAGDVRADENPNLQALHALFVREHNRLADTIAAGCAETGLDCSGDEIFLGAKTLVTVAQQKIFYTEVLPLIISADDPASILAKPALLEQVDGAINEFTTAAGRLGHSQVPNTILLAEPDGPHYEVPLAACFFDSACLADASLESVLYGSVLQAAETVDLLVADSLRNALVPGFGDTFLIDLLATNINRGRDHGLAGYLATREVLGLPARALSELVPPAVMDTYGEAQDIDLLTGLLAEFRPADAYIGETARQLWALQFAVLADEPGFYTAGALPPGVADWLDGVSMAGLIADNTGLVATDLGANVFLANTGQPVPLPPALVLVLSALAALRPATKRQRRPVGSAACPRRDDIPGARHPRQASHRQTCASVCIA